MHHCPFYHKSENPRRQATFQDLQRLDGNDRLLATIAHMEMWWRMVGIEDRDDDAEEALISGTV